MRIGIYGGTFNPPHIGHVQAAATAIERLYLDKLIVIAAGTPPHKALPEITPLPEQRLEMVRLAFLSLPRVEVSDIEIKRQGASYTSDTINELKRLYPQDEFFVVMGADMLASFTHWFESESIAALAVPAALARTEEDMLVLDGAAAEIEERCGVAPLIIRDSSIIDISSTRIREELPHRGGREYLTENVYGDIIKCRLYGARADFDWLREQAYAWLKPRRIPHVAGCEAEAVRLARRWGANEEDAREAAILHDITKKYELDDQLLLCKKYGILIDNTEKHEYKLLHSKTGAAVARSEYGVSEAVYNAIAWHTTGRADMTLLEKIVYLADYIEPTRCFEGLERLRMLAENDLDAALTLGLEMSVEDIESRGIKPHIKTIEAIEWMRSNGNKKGK